MFLRELKMFTGPLFTGPLNRYIIVLLVSLVALSIVAISDCLKIKKARGEPPSTAFVFNSVITYGGFTFGIVVGIIGILKHY